MMKERKNGRCKLLFISVVQPCNQNDVGDVNPGLAAQMQHATGSGTGRSPLNRRKYQGNSGTSYYFYFLCLVFFFLRQVEHVSVLVPKADIPKISSSWVSLLRHGEAQARCTEKGRKLIHSLIAIVLAWFKPLLE